MNGRTGQLLDWLTATSRAIVSIIVLGWSAMALAGSPEPAAAEADDKFQRDRQAILAMTGNYHVKFSFRETVSFVEGYTLKEPYEPDGYEIVRVIRDGGRVISLQHILVVQGIWGDPTPMKHWRQDWIYEPTHLFEYVGHNTWRTRQLDNAERRGKWAQLVFQVDDSPRYAALAEWTHHLGVSAWTSPPTWRPLPRREAKHRDDYDVLVSANRHALTPTGWVHEQESSKVSLRPDPRLIVREIGVNTYTATDALNVRLAEDYWNDTKTFWAEVRAEWNRLHDEPGMFGVKTQSQAGKLYNRVLTLANEAREGKLDIADAVKQARAIIRESTTTNVAELEIPGSGHRAEYAR